RIIHLEDKTTAAGLFAVLAEEYGFAPYRGTIRFALNREYVAETQFLSDGDEIAFITPVAGG
ncbi:MoaD/ThiS family protein, partial [bacterium]|nr:MoaD/ThiS family protein [bacterium]